MELSFRFAACAAASGRSAPPPVSPISSSELLRRCLRERRDADWGLFCRRYDAMLRRILGGMLMRRIPQYDGDEVDDALQEVYCRLLRYGGIFAGSTDRELWSFLCRTAASVVIDAWRWRQRRDRWRLISAGLVRSTEALAALGCERRTPGIRRGGRPPVGLPDEVVDRGPEELLLAREAALARYFSLPRRRRRLLWRQDSEAPALSPDQERR